LNVVENADPDGVDAEVPFNVTVLVDIVVPNGAVDETLGVRIDWF